MSFCTKNSLIFPVCWVIMLSGGCSPEAPTTLLVEISPGTIQLNQLNLNGWIDDKSRFTDKRFDIDKEKLQSRLDVVVVFPDHDAGKKIKLLAEGLLGGKTVGSGIAQAILRRNEMVSVKVSLETCQVGKTLCVGNTLTTCVSTKDGPQTTKKDCLLGCTQSSSMCRTILPSNLKASLVQKGKNPFVPKVGSVVTIDTTARSIEPKGFKPEVELVSQKNGPRIAVMAFSSITIAASVKVIVKGDYALALVASGDIVVQGVIDASAVDNIAGPGGGRGAALLISSQGIGAGNNGQINLLSSFGSGGGGGSFATAGGAGGTVGSGTNLTEGGKPGKIVGSEALPLIPLIGGSGGGLGSSKSLEVGNGGGGGGAIQIVSGTCISIGGGSTPGGITVGGGGGGHCTSKNCIGSGGGGGSGGGLLLEAPQLKLDNLSILAANGGGGGGGGGDGGGQKGNTKPTSGASGGLSDVPALGGEAGVSGSSGGVGYAAKGQAQSGGQLTSQGYGGGGGGGAGVIRINTLSGLVTSSANVIRSGSWSMGKIKVGLP